MTEQPRLLDPAAPDLDTLSAQLAALIAALPGVDAQVEALNRVRRALHAVSPLRAHPVDFVEWIPAAQAQANSYNPNTVAPPEMRLLRDSIRQDGYTMPVVTWPLGPEVREVVDGFHRSRVAREDPQVRRSTHGYLPVTSARGERQDLTARMAATVRHNEARGVHGVQATQGMVAQMLERGVAPEEVARAFGMDADELLRYRQRGGLLETYGQGAYSEAWE
jgi:ParB-like chromosome segregation protein Spo0J